MQRRIFTIVAPSTHKFKFKMRTFLALDVEA